MRLSARQLREINSHAPKIIVVVDTPEFKAGLLPSVADDDYGGSQAKQWRTDDARAAERLAREPLRPRERVY